MPKNKIKEIPQFEMPSNFIEQIYELSGNADKYKGVLLAYVSVSIQAIFIYYLLINILNNIRSGHFCYYYLELK